MAKIGYMRISTKIQDNALQKAALDKYGCDEIFDDKKSGHKKREGLENCLAKLQAGDTLVVWRLDRLGRRITHLSVLFEQLRERGVPFVSIMENFDTSTVAGRGMLMMMCVFAQMERELNGERVKAGLAVRKAAGGKLGPPFKITAEHVDKITEMGCGGMSQTAIAKELGISQASVSRVCRDRGIE